MSGDLPGYSLKTKAGTLFPNEEGGVTIKFKLEVFSHGLAQETSGIRFTFDP